MRHRDHAVLHEPVLGDQHDERAPGTQRHKLDVLERPVLLRHHDEAGAMRQTRERLRTLFEMLETRETMLRLLDASKQGEGVQIFIGAENRLFGVAGCSMVIAPYQNSREQIVGAIGVIGPTRINYARIIPMVDYTAKVIGRLIG